MRTRRVAVALLSSLLICVLCGVPALAQDRASYDWEMSTEGLSAFDGLTYQSGAITVTIAPGYCGRIVIQLPDANGQPQPAVTGLEVAGEGDVKVEQGGEVIFEDHIYGAMFRFHPDDYEAFVSLEGEEPRPEPGLRALLMHMCYGSFQRFWHRRMQAFVPDRGIGAAWVYSAQHGGVMIWENAQELGGYCMDTKEELFKR